MSVQKVVLLVLIALHCLFAVVAGAQVISKAKSFDAFGKVMGFFLAGLGLAAGFAGYRVFVDDFQLGFLVMIVSSGLLLFFGGPVPAIFGFLLSGGVKWCEANA